METIILLYSIGKLTKEDVIDASILYYSIDHKEGRRDNVNEILEKDRRREYTLNALENTKSKYKW